MWCAQRHALTVLLCCAQVKPSRPSHRPKVQMHRIRVFLARSACMPGYQLQQKVPQTSERTRHAASAARLHAQNDACKHGQHPAELDVCSAANEGVKQAAWLLLSELERASRT